MVYHINLSGEVGACKALVACPFGDFDTDHFTTKEQAQAAYEGMMAGKTIASFKSKEAHLAIVSSGQDKTQVDKKYEEFLQKLETPTTRIPPRAAPGHYRQITKYGELQEEDVVESLGVVKMVRRDDEKRLNIIYVDPSSSEPEKRRSFLVNPKQDLEQDRIWSHRRDPEEKAAFEAKVRERKIEDSALNFLKTRSWMSTAVASGAAYGHLEYLKCIRTFKANVKRLQRSGISLPYTRAYEATLNDLALAKVTGGRANPGVAIFSAIMEQDPKRIPKERYSTYFTKGEAPFLDIDILRIGKDRRARGLL